MKKEFYPLDADRCKVGDTIYYLGKKQTIVQLHKKQGYNFIETITTKTHHIKAWAMDLMTNDISKSVNA
jgi:hypothetical protein